MHLAGCRRWPRASHACSVYRGAGASAVPCEKDRRLTSQDEPGRGQETPEEREPGLTAALLRIGASLDLETVLNEVVESARALTGARYGAIATIDEAGQPQDFVTSGFTDEEHRAMVEWPDGPKLFEFFRDLPGPLRIPDVPAYVRSLGFSADVLPSKTFQGTPLRHRGVHVGNFYLVEKEGGAAFTDRDEEVLLLFAAQAAAAIAHARTYRDERRGRRCRQERTGLGGFQRCVVNGPLLLQSPHVVKGFRIGQLSSVETDDEGLSINLDTLQKTKPRSLIGFTRFLWTAMEVYGKEGWCPQRDLNPCCRLERPTS